MRIPSFGLAALALFALPFAVRADDSTSAKDVLDKSVAALGGREKAASLSDVTLKGKGQSVENGKVGECQFDLSINDLSKARLVLTLTENAAAHTVTVVMAEDKVWVRESSQDMTSEAPE